MIERDDQIPELDELVQELQIARDITADYLSVSDKNELPKSDATVSSNLHHA